jgi:hypothetical protein
MPSALKTTSEALAEPRAGAGEAGRVSRSAATAFAPPVVRAANWFSEISSSFQENW